MLPVTRVAASWRYHKAVLFARWAHNETHCAPRFSGQTSRRARTLPRDLFPLSRGSAPTIVARSSVRLRWPSPNVPRKRPRCFRVFLEVSCLPSKTRSMNAISEKGLEKKQSWNDNAFMGWRGKREGVLTYSWIKNGIGGYVLWNPINNCDLYESTFVKSKARLARKYSKAVEITGLSRLLHKILLFSTRTMSTNRK